MIIHSIKRDDMIILVAAIFALEHNHRKPNSSAIEIMERSFDAATVFVDYCRIASAKAKA